MSSSSKDKKMPDVIMKRSDVIEEHRRLPRILRRGSKIQREVEAKKQAGELKKYLKY
jgi:tetrahydromethanopterin S-methyltransferase subunit G